MKTRMKKLFIYTVGICLLPAFTSCKDDREENKYTGINKIYLSAETPVITESENIPLTVNVDLTLTCEQDLVLNFELPDDKNGVLKLENNPVTIKAGKRSATFEVVPNQKNLLTEDTYFQVGISQFPTDNLMLNETLQVRVKPNPKIPELSPQQKALIKGYKTKYGIDLNKWLGVLSCHTTVQSPADGYLQPFAAAFTKEYDGKTVITLSEQATEDMPVLKMTDNPFGLTEYLYFVLRSETVADPEFWTQQPEPQKLMKLLNWNKESKETFAVSLDAIRLKDITSTSTRLEYLGPGKNYYGAPITIVPFTYQFSALDRQNKLLESGNAEIKEINDQGASADPAYYLNCYDLVNSDYYDTPENFIKSTGNIDFATDKMTYQFLLSHANAGGYTRITVVYEKK